MKKLLCFALLTLAACKTPPSFEGVKLEDGNDGYKVDCHDMNEVECLTYTRKVCSKGFHFLHRNVANKSNNLLIKCQ